MSCSVTRWLRAWPNERNCNPCIPTWTPRPRSCSNCCGNKPAGTLLILTIQREEHLLVGQSPGFYRILFEMPFESLGRGAAILYIITDKAKGRKGAEIIGNHHAGSVLVPAAIAAIREILPGEVTAGVVLTGSGDVPVT